MYTTKQLSSHGNEFESSYWMKETVMEPEALTQLIPDLPLHVILSHLYLSILLATCLFNIYLIWCYPEISFLGFQVVTFKERLAQK
jgi:hypothetical protein